MHIHNFQYRKNFIKKDWRKKLVFWWAIFGMICWGIGPLFAKFGLEKIDPVAGLAVRTIFACLMVLICIIINGLGGLRQIKNIPINTWIFIAIEALLATLIGDLAYYAAIKGGDVSLVTIIMSTSPLITVIGATIFLGEQITISRIIGTLFIIFGIIFLMR